MSSLEEQIVELEEEIRRTSYNKATQLHIGRLKAKIAVLRLEREARARGKGGGVGYAVRKSGHATMGLVGFPSVGKSTLLTALTGAASEAAAYDFTTLTIIPGMMRLEGAAIQILDMPGLVPGASKGRGRGREVLSVVRSTDLVLFLVDPEHLEIQALVRELEIGGVRVNARRPKIVVRRGVRGGLEVTTTAKLTRMDSDTVSEIVREFGIHNGTVVLREDATPDQLIDVLAGNRVYLPAVLAVNKSELLSAEDRQRLATRLAAYRPVFVSAKERSGLEELRGAIGQALDFIRIYVKPPGRQADRKEPVILRRGDRVEQLLRRLPAELETSFRAAQIWGPSARFPGQTVGREHRLADEDVVTVVVARTNRAAAS